jgi:hypothetical protein
VLPFDDIVIDDVDDTLLFTTFVVSCLLLLFMGVIVMIIYCDVDEVTLFVRSDLLLLLVINGTLRYLLLK